MGADCSIPVLRFTQGVTEVEFSLDNPCPVVSGTITRTPTSTPGRYKIVIVLRDISDAENITISFEASGTGNFNVTDRVVIGSATVPPFIETAGALTILVQTAQTVRENFSILISFNVALDEVLVRLEPILVIESTQGAGSIPFICGEEFILNIRADTNPATGEIVCVMFDVLDCEYHPCGFGKYQGTSIPIDNGTRIWVLNLKVNSVIRGIGTPKMKFKELGVNGSALLEYILIKIIMGRILFGEMNICWALTENYYKLIGAVSRSSVYNKILPFLTGSPELEASLR